MSERDRVDKLNASTMSLVTLLLVVVFCYLSAAQILDSGVFANAMTLVLGYWFGQRTKVNGNGKQDSLPPTPESQK